MLLDWVSGDYFGVTGVGVDPMMVTLLLVCFELQTLLLFLALVKPGINPSVPGSSQPRLLPHQRQPPGPTDHPGVRSGGEILAGV